MIQLALASGIPMSEWERGGPRAIATAIDILNGSSSSTQDGPPMRG